MQPPKQEESSDFQATPFQRRSISKAILAAACSPWLMDLSQAFAKEDDLVQPDGCTLGFSTYGMKTLPTETAIDALTDIGFDSIEIVVRAGWDADSSDLSQARRQAIRKRLASSNLELSSLMEHVYATSAESQKIALQRLPLAFQLAHDLQPVSPPLVQTVLGGGKFAEKKELLRDHLAKWVELADLHDIRIAIKPHRGGVISQPSEAIWLIEQLGNPQRLSIVYDYSHYAFRKLTIDETVAVALPHTSHIAVKDAVPTGKKVAFELPGSAGTIDFAKLIRLFHAGGYRGDVNCEVSGMVWSKSGYDPIAAAKFCYQKMETAFKQSGVIRRSV